MLVCLWPPRGKSVRTPGEAAIVWISFPSAKLIWFFRGNALSWQSELGVGLFTLGRGSRKGRRGGGNAWGEIAADTIVFLFFLWVDRFFLLTLQQRPKE